jgi:hypothetical protein
MAQSLYIGFADPLIQRREAVAVTLFVLSDIHNSRRVLRGDRKCTTASNGYHLLVICSSAVALAGQGQSTSRGSDVAAAGVGRFNQLSYALLVH